MDNDELDKSVDVYYTNLINSIILFSLTTEELEELDYILLDPLFELWSEFDYAFSPFSFETIFRNNYIHESLKNEFQIFKENVENIPSEIWDWEFIDNHDTWTAVRQKANSLLDKLGLKSRIYNDDFTTIYDSDGKVLLKGKKQL